MPRSSLPWFAIAAGLFAFPSSALRADDFQTWWSGEARWIDAGRVSSATTFDARFSDDGSRLFLARVGQVLATEPLPWLDAGLGYRHTWSRGAEGPWGRQHRFEFEITPHLEIGSGFGISLRNRLELRRDSGGGGSSDRHRSRLRLVWETPRLGPVTAVFADNEVFHDFDRNVIAENRAVPFGLRLGLREGATMSIAYMVRSLRGTEAWRHDHVLVTGLSLRL